MNVNHIRRTIDLNTEIERDLLKTLFASGDANAHRFTLTLHKGGDPVDVSGCEVTWYFRRVSDPKEKTVIGKGEATGNTITFRLNANCYAEGGAFTLAVKVSESDEIGTVYYASGNVRTVQGGEVEDPDDTVIPLEELTLAGKEARAATLEAKNAALEANTQALNAHTEAMVARAAAAAASEALEDTEQIRLAADLAQESMRLSTTLAEQAETENRKATAAAQEAVAQTQGWASTTATAESIAPGSVPVVTMIEGETGRHLHFAIPRGDAAVRGEDYWTDADKAEIKAYVDDAILNGSW